MSQTKTQSLVESCVNLAVGYLLAIVAQRLIFPVFGFVVPLKENMLLAAVFSGISIVRSYVVRRAFNWWHHRAKPRTFNAVPGSRSRP